MGDTGHTTGPTALVLQPRARPLAPTSPLERMPPELVLMVGDHLPVHSRTALALTSRTMYARMGGVGPGSGNHADDTGPSFPPATLAPPLTPRMLFLGLLERESPGLTRCDYCRKLHSATQPGPAGAAGQQQPRACERPENAVFLRATGGRITLPLVRAAVQRDRDGLDPSDLLGDVSRDVRIALPGTPYTAVADYEARVINGSVLLRKQVFVARDAPYSGPGGRPTPAELLALSSVLAKLQNEGDAADRLWWGLCAIPLVPCLVSILGGGGRKEDKDGGDRAPDNTPAAGCGHPRLDVKPPNLPPGNWEYNPEQANKQLPRCCTAWAPILGQVQGSDQEFLDYSMTAYPAPDEVGARVLVFTWWRDLGSGNASGNAKWRARSGGFTSMWFRQANRSVQWDVAQAFEQQAWRGWYVTRPTWAQAEMLYSPWRQVPDWTRREYLKTCRPQ